MRTRPKVIVHNHFSTKDNWYHKGIVNGYYILEGAMGDKGRCLIRNGKYDIVHTANSYADAESFAKRQKPGGASASKPVAKAADAVPKSFPDKSKLILVGMRAKNSFHPSDEYYAAQNFRSEASYARELKERVQEEVSEQILNSYSDPDGENLQVAFSAIAAAAKQIMDDVRPKVAKLAKGFWK